MRAPWAGRGRSPSPRGPAVRVFPRLCARAARVAARRVAHLPSGPGGGRRVESPYTGPRPARAGGGRGRGRPGSTHAIRATRSARTQRCLSKLREVFMHPFPYSLRSHFAGAAPTLCMRDAANRTLESRSRPHSLLSEQACRDPLMPAAALRHGPMLSCPSVTLSADA